jgi:hypothetical protein
MKLVKYSLIGFYQILHINAENKNNSDIYNINTQYVSQLSIIIKKKQQIYFILSNVGIW